MTKEEVLKGLECCVDYMCGDCPYQYLASWEFPIKCMRTLLVDLQNLKEKEEEYR